MMLTQTEAWAYLHRHAVKHGYDVADVFFYTLDLLDVLCDAVVGDYIPQSQGDGRSPGDPAEGGNMLAMLGDVSRALYGPLMDASQRAVLLLHYGGYIAASTEALDAALTALQDALGGARP